MRSQISVFATFCMLLLSMQSQLAVASSSSDTLINACHELTGIYESRTKMDALAGVTASVSEALKAGYCMGVLKEYKRQSRCYASDWFEMAEFIANQDGFEQKFSNTHQLLKMACNG